MFVLTDLETSFIGLFLGGFFYGLYSGIFLQYQTSKKDAKKTRNIIFYSICALYVLCATVFLCDIESTVFHALGKPSSSVLPIDLIQAISFGSYDFIAQFILIYRCWIVWGRNIHVVIIPSILAFTFLCTWLAGCGSTYVNSDKIVAPYWGYSLSLSGLILSLTVNALVTGLIVFKIFKVFREVKATSDDEMFGTSSGRKLRRIMFILIESGMALFAIQLTRVVVTIVRTEVAHRAFNIIVIMHEMLNGITPTIILVRTSMGLSFDDEKSMEEVIGSLCFASNQLNSAAETGSINIIGQARGDDGDIKVRRSNDIDIVHRWT